MLKILQTTEVFWNLFQQFNYILDYHVYNTTPSCSAENWQKTSVTGGPDRVSICLTCKFSAHCKKTDQSVVVFCDSNLLWFKFNKYFLVWKKLIFVT
jgi:hypothetical protein